MKRLLRHWLGLQARVKRQQLKEKLHWIIFQDQVNGWIKTYSGFQCAPEVRV